jgi:hypothetical protein
VTLFGKHFRSGKTDAFTRSGNQNLHLSSIKLLSISKV